MRCTKCGFVSFDYHSECRKCGTSLAQAREQLGFSSAKPGVPSLLGALLREHEPQAVEEKPVAAAADISPSFDFGDELGEGFRQVDEFSLAPGAAIPNPDEGEEDYSLLDLSDEELELLIDKEPGDSAQRPDLWLELDSDNKPSEPPSPGTRTEHPVMQTESEEADRLSDLIPRLDSGPLPGPAEKTPPDEPPELELVMDEPEDLTQATPAPPKTAAAPQEQAAAPSPEAADLTGEATDDFVIDLTDSDLENLLLELDTSRKKEEPEEKEGKPSGSKSKE